MPFSSVSANIHSPTVGVMIDMGHPLLNITVDGFLKIGTVGASRVIVEDAYQAIDKGSISKSSLKHTGIYNHSCGKRNRLWNRFSPGEDRNRGIAWNRRNRFKKMGTEGLQWGAVAGVYTGTMYGVERVRGRRDWKNALISGALTGAVVSVGDGHAKRDKIVKTAILGGAIATAMEFIKYLT